MLRCLIDFLIWGKWYELIQFIDDSVVTYFLGHPVYEITARPTSVQRLTISVILVAISV